MLQQITKSDLWPLRYNHSYIHLMAQSPHTLFAYWEVHERRKQFIAEHYQMDWHALQKLLRLTELSSSAPDATTVHYTDVLVSDHDSWYFHHLKSDVCYRIEYGIWNAEHQFVSLLQSGRVITPRQEPHAYSVQDTPVEQPTLSTGIYDSSISSNSNVHHSPFEQFSTYTLYQQPPHSQNTMKKECNHDNSS